MRPLVKFKLFKINTLYMWGCQIEVGPTLITLKNIYGYRYTKQRGQNHIFYTQQI